MRILNAKLAAGLLVLAAGVAMLTLRGFAAQEQKAPPLPTAEMQKLSKLYVGTWEYTESYPKSAFFPNGGVNTGTYTSELGPGGNSIFNKFHSKGPVGEFSGAIVMTWDPKEKAYKEFVFGDDFPGAMTGTGQWEGELLIYRAEFSMGASKLVMKTVTKFLEGGKLTSDAYSSVNGSPEALMVHVEAVRK